MGSILLLILSTTFLPWVRSQWDVSVKFVNSCPDHIELSAQGDDGNSVESTLDPGDSITLALCSYGCTGWLGSSYTYQFSWQASAASPDCTWDDSGSGSVSINGFDASGVSDEVSIDCGSMVCGSGEEERQEEEVSSSSSDSGISSSSSSSLDCAGFSTSSGSNPSKDDVILAVAADLANEVYTLNSDDENSAKFFQEYAQGLLGAGCAELYTDNAEDTEVGIAVTGDAIYVAFRGSEEDSLDDWQNNLQTETYELQSGDWSVNLHSGFWDAWEAVSGQVKDIIDRNPGKKLYLMGHSLGGALAQIAAFGLERDGEEVDAVFTFGSPRVGLSDWASFAESTGLSDKILNVIDPSDPVPFLPTESMGYYRTGRLLKLQSSTCTEATDDEINDSWSILNLDLSSHYLESYIQNLMSNCILNPDDFYSCKGDPSQYTSYKGNCDAPVEGSDDYDNDSSQVTTGQEADDLQYGSSSATEMSQKQQLTIFIAVALGHMTTGIFI